jgi:predicted dehydrogenase
MTNRRGAIIGFGQIAEHGHWPSYKNSADLELVAVSDSSSERLLVAKQLAPHLRAYATVDELLSMEKLDFVDICTPPTTHSTFALQALAKGCHVLCEKPLTLQGSEYEELARAIEQNEKTVFTVHNWKYAPIFQKAFSLIQEGRIGRVWHVELFTLRDRACAGTTTPQQLANWRRQGSLAGGGILVDHGWHSFYLLLNLIKAEPQTVLAKMLKEQEDSESLEEAAQTLVQFSEASAYIHLTWHAQERKNQVIVQGLSGTLLIDDNRILLTTHEGEREEIRFEESLSAGSHHPDWFKNMLPDFLGEMNGAQARGTNFKEAGLCLELMTAAYQSNAQGFKEVNLVDSLRLKTF